MANTLSRAVAFWARGVLNSGRAIVNLVFAILSGFLAIRDGVMPQAWREVFLSKYIPQLPWYIWALICLTSLLVFIFFVVPNLHHKAILAQRAIYRKRLRENEVLHGVRHLVRDRLSEAKEKDSKPSEETRPKARPDFVLLPQTAFAGLLELDVNVFRKTNETKDTFFPIIVSLENVPRSEGFNETDEVWAHITYRERGFGDMELERANSGCWVGELLPDVSFPFHKPRHLILGVWRVNGKKPVENDFRVFEYSRELHRPVEKSGFEAPRNLLIDVVLTHNGHHELSCRYQFDIDLTSPGWYKLNRYKLPTRPESKVEAGKNPNPPVTKPVVQEKHAASPDKRIFVNVTPDYLMDFYNDIYTALQSSNLAAPFRGKWMKLSGTIDNIEGTRQHATVRLKITKPGKAIRWISLYFYEEWSDRLSVLQRGDEITAVGQIHQIFNNKLSLDKCELIDA